MQISKVLKGICPCQSDKEVTGIAIDSRKVKKGDLFFALSGSQNGLDFEEEALSRGAVGIVAEKSRGKGEFLCQDVRKAYALASKNFYGAACDSLKIVGVTGTNGKTTTVNLIADILEHQGFKVARVGTMGAHFAGKNVDTGMTTPDPHVLHSLFKSMKDEGCEYVIMEVSAHALALKKLEGVKFSIGILTNITQDHLDFFGTMERYAEAKRGFFNSKNMLLGLVCAQDHEAMKVLSSSDVPILTYGAVANCDICAFDIKKSFEGSSFLCNALDEIERFSTELVGGYNVLNALAAIGATRCLGLHAPEVRDALESALPVEGRFNVIRRGGFNVVIDYAHTPDGIEKVTKTCRDLTSGRVITLFGCGGNRDKTKRPIMGRVAGENSDLVIVTSDNPRFEDAGEIVQQVASGVQGAHVDIVDRKEAIFYALSICEDGDTLIIAGKGGEKYQEIEGQRLPYNDFDEVYKFFRGQIKVVEEEDA